MEMSTITQKIFNSSIHPARDKIKNNGTINQLPENIIRKINKKTTFTNEEILACLQYTSQPEAFLELCFHMEEKGYSRENMETMWIAGLEKFSNSSVYLENIGIFYYCNEKYHQALNYLSKTHQIEKSFFSLCLAIVAASLVAQYHLTWDYYTFITPKDRLKLDNEILMKVAGSAMELKKYEEAAEIYALIQKSNNIETLPTLRDSLLARFQNEVKIIQWVENMEETRKNSKLREATSLADTITYASALMYLNKFQEAMEYMQLIKQERYS